MSQELLKYQKLSEKEHVLKRSGMWLGSTTVGTLDFFVPTEDHKMILRPVTSSPALIKMCDEVISNSVDEHVRSGNVTRIDVTYSEMTGEIVVKDNGGIPVKKHPEYKEWIPSMIFGQLRTGSNFSDDDRTTAGLNGLGSVLVNIFSTEFRVETSDGSNKLTQLYRNNMDEVNDPVITKSSEKGTTISFIPDYERLNCSLDQDTIARIERRVYDVAGCNPKIKVYLNGTLIKANKFTDFVSMFVESYVSDSNDTWEVCVAPSVDDTFRHISFVNGVDTFNGGTHVEYISNQITNKLREYIKKKHKIDVKPNNIKQQLFLFIKSTINAPMFTSQTKEYLSTDVKDFGTEFEVTDRFINKIVQSDVVQRVLDWAMAQQRQKELAELRKLEKKKKAHKSEKYFPATQDKKFLIAGEGASALGGLIPALGRKQNGYFELRGKPLNCWNATVTKFKDNKEMADLYAVLCNEGYEYFIIGSDQDLDGLHIRMLLVAFVAKYVPEYLNKFGYLDTPVIVIKKRGKIVRWYYSLNDEYELKSGEEAIYYKGLGTWDKKDLQYIVEKDGLENMIKLIDLSDIEQYTNWLQDDRVDQRKEQLNNHTFSIARL